MSKLDRLKLEFSTHKQIFFAAWATALGLVGWAASHVGKVSQWLLAASLAGTIFAAIVGEYQRRRMNQLLEEIENV